MLIGAITAGAVALMGFIYGLLRTIQNLKGQNAAYEDENERLRLQKMSESLNDSDLYKRISDDITKLGG